MKKSKAFWIKVLHKQRASLLLELDDLNRHLAEIERLPLEKASCYIHHRTQGCPNTKRKHTPPRRESSSWDYVDCPSCQKKRKS